ncbi:precorrin-6y C5,15-methyltransferase (decarboxylating) subunit CbiE [Methylocystis bryophila]|uniref:Cobalamin biosynthesis bifunctional protein CbiET n=1 Tax=Methylocystis bryophila TaxID=655015 RepID=A0A1W6MZ88_9HYPH|nr:precorrin-6y C5,15-methyltransferase (decarboxylating) subunit CbiE [Methylocystis bryophila]ARN82902.1 cobalamin biosynthesis bifunctional protein CbiET [Methylocystis bryophila]BDV39179.1 precorrin-6Y methyltransferase [Methylocystis bryophila]
MTGRWLTILGVGEDGALSSAARASIDAATAIFGGARHLALLGPTKAAQRPWPSPFALGVAEVMERRGAPTVVLASGDPFFYGVGSTLAEKIARDEIFCLPAPSTFALVAARLAWSQQDCVLLSLHGRAFERVTPHLQPGRRLIALSWDETTPARLAEHLIARGFGRSVLHVLENLGGPRERIRSAAAAEFAFQDISPLNAVAVELIADADARVIPLTPGLPDEWFEHDGQLTKREVRAVTLSGLAPKKGERLWDIGAGAGSIAIEWMLADPANRAVAIERDETRASRIARNAAALGVPDLEILRGAAPAALAGLEPPDAIFIGGGGRDAIEAAWAALPGGGRIVVNAVTLETQALLSDLFAARGGDLVEVRIAKARAVGGFHALDPAMAVLQWRGQKP